MSFPVWPKVVSTKGGASTTAERTKIRCYGKTPMQIFPDTLPVAKETMLRASA